MNNLLTASRMSALLTCPRKHYWNYEIGLRPETSGLALRIGSAMARGQEARSNGRCYEDALLVTLTETFDEVTGATIAALLAGYYKRYENDTLIKKVHPEVKFEENLEGSRTFKVAGKLDGLCELKDGRLAVKEDKTTSDSVADDSYYWLRLRFNPQLMQYVLAARKLGWNVDCVIYDVVRKPGIRPKQVPKQDRIETADEFGDRLLADTQARPEFYFARREVPILETDLEEFVAQRLVLSKLIIECRQIEKKLPKPESAWPRNVSENTCSFCPYAGFCLQNISIDPNNQPGFKIEHNPELK
jgi:hypothetical protein